MNLWFSLCSRCKGLLSHHNPSFSITLDSRVYGTVCSNCLRHIAEQVTLMMTEIPIPEALKPYLIPPSQCPACLKEGGHRDGCPEKNMMESETEKKD